MAAPHQASRWIQLSPAEAEKERDFAARVAARWSGTPNDNPLAEGYEWRGWLAELIYGELSGQEVNRPSLDGSPVGDGGRDFSDGCDVKSTPYRDSGEPWLCIGPKNDGSYPTAEIFVLVQVKEELRDGGAAGRIIGWCTRHEILFVPENWHDHMPLPCYVLEAHSLHAWTPKVSADAFIPPAHQADLFQV